MLTVEWASDLTPEQLAEQARRAEENARRCEVEVRHWLAIAAHLRSMSGIEEPPSEWVDDHGVAWRILDGAKTYPCTHQQTLSCGVCKFIQRYQLDLVLKSASEGHRV